MIYLISLSYAVWLLRIKYWIRSVLCHFSVGLLAWLCASEASSFKVMVPQGNSFWKRPQETSNSTFSSQQGWLWCQGRLLKAGRVSPGHENLQGWSLEAALQAAYFITLLSSWWKFLISSFICLDPCLLSSNQCAAEKDLAHSLFHSMGTPGAAEVTYSPHWTHQAPSDSF